MQGVRTRDRLPDDMLNYPRSEYEGELFVAAIRRGELQLPAVEPESGASRNARDDFRAVRAFIASLGGFEEDAQRQKSAARDTAAAGAADADADAGAESAEDELEASTKTSTRKKQKKQEAAASAAKTSDSKSTSSKLTRHVHDATASFAWRGGRFTASGFKSNEEAARFRDRCILAAQWLDKRDKRRDGPSEGDLSFGRDAYKKDPLFGALERGALDAVDASHTRALFRAVRDLVRDTPMEEEPAAEADEATSKGDEVEQESEQESKEEESEGDETAEEQRGSSAGVQLRKRRKSAGKDDKACLGKMAKRPRTGTKFLDRQECADFISTRWRELVTPPLDLQFSRKLWASVRLLGKLRSRVAPEVYEVAPGRHVAAFYLEAEKVLSPLLPSVDDAQRFRDRCYIAWFGPKGPGSESEPLNFPLAEYKKEAVYKELFGGPKAGRPTVGENDPNWEDDVALAVARTLEYIAVKTGALEARGGRHAF
eukprot:tig00000093_g3628.t1